MGSIDWRTLRSRITHSARREITRRLPNESHRAGVTDPTQPEIPTPLSRDRIVEWLTQQNMPHFIDSDGDVGAIQDSRIFYMLTFGQSNEVLQVRGRWNRQATIERAEQIRVFCNDWNTTKIWPKAYYRVRDDGIVQVYGEVTHDFEHGATAAQLGTTIACGLHTTAQLFDELDRYIPDTAMARR
ncbi:YbjN domain-containing protein [Jonesia quinghaiensis]|uniref:YbjN domain-containing protein n=1 Tax=Jonesia quinghaiensis TaxID=262806 RepID=UPI0004009671|nr:YbjN domain-containing protein [Jonesia quinghaiensis]